LLWKKPISGNKLSKWHSLWDKHPYTSWDCHPYKKKLARKAEYCSMFFKQWLKINGEPVKPEITVTQFGIDGTDCPQMIEARIDHVRTCNEYS